MTIGLCCRAGLHNEQELDFIGSFVLNGCNLLQSWPCAPTLLTRKRAESAAAVVGQTGPIRPALSDMMVSLPSSPAPGARGGRTSISGAKTSTPKYGRSRL